ncbi:MAG: GDSL-type esterase/lipase family protein [Planctomycetota bacterium]
MVAALPVTPAIAQPAPQPAPHPNPQPIVLDGFEAGVGPWSGLVVRSSEYEAPPEGRAYGVVAAGGRATRTVQVQAGVRYRLTAWASSVYDDATLDCLANCGFEDLPSGVAGIASARLAVADANNQNLASTGAPVSPRALTGAAQTRTNDDGANVWLDGGFRHAFSENHFYQPGASDPILDPWAGGDLPFNFFQDDMLAKGCVVFPDGSRRLYGFNSDNPFCQGTGETCQAVIFTTLSGGGNPLYATPQQPDNNYIAFNAGDEDPWLGGGTGMYVAELDPATGYLKGAPNQTVRFDDRPDLFTRVADWSGDEWTLDSEWFEGGALWQEGPWWYLMTSNGSLAENYTLRVGRSDRPTGPFLDKDGRSLTAFDPADNEFGNSFLLGDDADQVLPGHAHVWAEGSRRYLGYDYRLTKANANDGDDESFDFLGVRELRFVDGWPTVWPPLELEFVAPATGPITLNFDHTGDAGTLVGLDRVELVAAGDPPTEIACLGDSITEWLPFNDYPTELELILGDGFDVLDFESDPGHGVSGATLVRGTAISIWDTLALADLLTQTPDIVTVMLGSNDVSEETSAALRANYEQDLRNLVALLRSIEPEPEVVLATPPPQFAFSPAGDARLQSEIIPAIDSVAKDLGLRVIDVYDRTTDYPDNWPDGLHPVGEGIANLADVFFFGLLEEPCPPDVNRDDALDGDDFNARLANFLQGGD